MEKKSAAATRPSTTEPEDLNLPKHEPPSMPEAADKPDDPTKDPVADAAISAPATTGGVAPRIASVPGAQTEPEDLHVPKHEPPPMPEAADKPDRPANDRPTESLR